MWGTDPLTPGWGTSRGERDAAFTASNGCIEKSNEPKRTLDQLKGEPKSRNRYPLKCLPFRGVPRGGPQPPPGKLHGEDREPALAGSQDGLANDTNEAVWPLSLRSAGSPLDSRRQDGDEGAQVSAALQVQHAGLSPRGQQLGPGSPGLQWSHDLGENKERGRGSASADVSWALPPLSTHAKWPRKTTAGIFPKWNPLGVPETFNIGRLF